MIPFNNRFHGHSSLRYVYKNGQTVRSRLVTLKVAINPNRKNSRIAVVVSKKIFKSAVKRNRIRRRIYEYIRPKIGDLKDIFDIVIIVSSGEMLTMPYEEVVSQMDQILQQAELLK